MIRLNYRVKVGAAPTQDVAVHLEMFATTQSRKLVQGTTRVVPCRNIHTGAFILLHVTNVLSEQLLELLPLKFS